MIRVGNGIRTHGLQSHNLARYPAALYPPYIKNEPEGIRTPDPRLRRPLLYPTELLNHINLERAMGIEPTTSAWKAEVLPLNYTRMVGVAGFEPATPCSQGRCATKLRYTPNTKGIILFN